MKPKPALLRRLPLTIVLFLAALLPLSASPAWNGALRLTQPDGSFVDAFLSGDEYGHLMLTPDGCSLLQDGDGWWCYARYDYYGNRINTGEHAGASDTPGGIIAASRNIPHDLLRMRRSARRRQAESLRGHTLLRTRSGEEAGGFRRGLIILAQFQDLSFQHTREAFENIINGSGPGTALSYFKDQWDGHYTFQFDISDIVTLPQSYAYYGANDSNGQDKNPAQMVVDACEAAGSSIDFSRYDNDGDGEVDNVFIFYAGPNESEGAGDNHIWPHMWYLQSGARITYRRDGVLLDNYACTSELMLDDNRQTYTTLASIGTFCHEYTHTFGIPDLYDVDEPNSGGYAEAFWKCIDLMDSGNYNNRGRTPPNYSAVERWYFKMNEGVELTEGTHTLRPIQDGGAFYILPTDTEGELYLLECRDNKGWDAYIGGSGLLIYHIDDSERATGEAASDDHSGEKEVTAHERWDLNQINVSPEHQCADVIEPDPEARRYFQDAAKSRNWDAINALASHAFWPYGDINVFTVDTDPAFRFWSGAEAPLGLADIRRNDDGSVTFTAFSTQEGKVPGVQVDDQLVFQDATLIQFSCTDPSFTGEGVIRYGKVDANRLTEAVVSAYEPGKYAFLIEGLEPTTAYKIQLLCRKGNIPGPIYGNIEFTTHSGPKSGSYPFIYLRNIDRNPDGSFPAGAPLCLRVNNAPGAAVRWYFDEKAIFPGPDGYYHLTRSGRLKAVVTYPESSDIIIKDIIVP